MAFTNKKKAGNKKALFPLDKHSDSTSKNERFVKKMRFHQAKKLPLLAVYEKPVESGFQ